MVDPIPAPRGLILVDKTVTHTKASELVAAALNRFQIELPSWGFANTGTRFGKFLQAAAASTLEEKFSDAGEVHRWTGRLPDGSPSRSLGSPRGHGQRLRGPAPGRSLWRAPRLHQSECLSGPDLQARLLRQSRSQGAPGSAAPCARQRRDPDASGQPRSISMVRGRLKLSRHAEVSANASSGSRKASRRPTPS